jgi:enterochelin esterase family protein
MPRLASTLRLLAAALLVAVAPLAAQPARTPPSPEFSADGAEVTFRVRAPAAREVKFWGEWSGEKSFTAGEDGVWSLTLPTPPPDHYSYRFTVDGLAVLDPANPVVKPARRLTDSVLHVPGAEPWDARADSPRGTLHLHDYDSASLGRVRRLRIYTPAAYDASPDARFPVLYLFHGAGDNEATWTEFGRAHLIFDNLVAAGRARPCIVVMPDGHALVDFLPEARAANVAAFTRDFLENVVPFVEARYRVAPGRENAAVAGLSMGGNQALVIGLTHLDRFAWIGAMSSAVRDPEQSMPGFLAAPETDASRLRLLWLRIGEDDFLLEHNRRFHALLSERGVPHDYAETAGAHTWPVWRRYLADLAPLLFTAPTAP